MGEMESVTFSGGINTKKSSLFLGENELVSCSGVDYETDGMIQTRGALTTVNGSYVGSIHSIHRMANWVLVGDGSSLRYKWDLNGYCDLYTPANENFTFVNYLSNDHKWKIADYGMFSFIAIGSDVYAFYNGYLYNCCTFLAPTAPPLVTDSGGSGTEVEYTYYYTYVYRFPNGHIFETGLSPGKAVTAYDTGATMTIQVFNTTQFLLSNAYSSTSEGNDIYTKLLLHFDGTDAATSTIDSSSSGHVPTFVGNAQLDTAQKKFGASSLLLDGTGDCLTIPDSLDFDCSLIKFTLDFRVRFNVLPTSGNYAIIAACYQDAANYWYFGLYNSGATYSWQFYYLFNGTDVVDVKFTTTVSINTWYHVEFDRDYVFRSWYRCYQDGVQVGGDQYSSVMLNRISGTLYIGQHGHGADYFNGWIDELRYSRSINRHIFNFTPPTVAYGNVDWNYVSSQAGIDVFYNVYRTSETLGEYYKVYDGLDKIGLTCTDTYDESELGDLEICSTEEYDAWPSGIIDIAIHLHRLFGIENNNLWFSEPYMPFAVKGSSAIAIAGEEENMTAVCNWSEQLYISSAKAWYRLQGTDDTTWSIRKTYAETGCINRHTAISTRFGIINLWWDGLYIFNGNVNMNITKDKIAKTFFTETIKDVDDCSGTWDGYRYYFHYSSTTAGTVDACLVLDFTHSTAQNLDLRIYNMDDHYDVTTFEYHLQTGIKYYGKADGYQYKDGTTETIPLSLQTGDKVFKNVLKHKRLVYLYYDINTAGKDVVLTFYTDGVAENKTITLNHSSRKRARIDLPGFEGYRFSIKLDCVNGQGVYIYEPWALESDSTGM